MHIISPTFKEQDVLDRQAHFLISSSSCQWESILLSTATARDIRGSPKRPKPTPSVTNFMKRYELKNMETARSGITKAANLRRVACFGKGGVGDRAL